MSDITYYQNRLNTVESTIEEYENALFNLGNGIQSYMIDTGQSRQNVTKFDIGRINKLLESLYDRREMLMNKISGTSGSVIGQPAW